MQPSPKLSAVLITYNTADSINRCLHSLTFANEIVVVDSASTDGTPQLAREAGARVIDHEWLGFGRQKQFAVESALHDWVLCIDADEIVTDSLRQAILTTLAATSFDAYEIARSNYFMGRYLRHGEGFPDWSLRLFDRRHATWSDDVVHEKVLTQRRVGRLNKRNALLHHSAESLPVYLEKQNRYTTLQARELFAKGERAGFGRLLLSPALRFLKFYLFRQGFRDGLPGLIHIAIGCFNSFAKYAKLRALNEENAS